MRAETPKSTAQAAPPVRRIGDVASRARPETPARSAALRADGAQAD
jgi:hypothetical protein